MIADASAPTIDAPAPARRRILGVRVDDASWEECLALARFYVSSGRAHTVATPNPEIVMRARRSETLAAAIEAADLAPADGVGLLWAGRMLGQPIREVVPGSDLVVRLARQARSGERWFLLGGAEGVAEEAGRALAGQSAGLLVAGTYGGSPGPLDDAEACRRIEAAGPVDVLLVAYGAPGQELWLARNQPRLGVPLAIGVGGTFNFLAGRSPLPPGWVRRARLIWLFRLVTEPWRWRRQRVLLEFVGRVLAEAARQRAAGRVN